MENQTIKRFSVINRSLKETKSGKSPTYSLGELYRLLNIDARTIKSWIQQGTILPDWALQKLGTKSHWIRTKEGERFCPPFIHYLSSGMNSISVKLRRDGIPMDIPANEIPNFTPPKYSKEGYIIPTSKRVSHPSESFISTLAAVGRKDMGRTIP